MATAHSAKRATLWATLSAAALACGPESRPRGVAAGSGGSGSGGSDSNGGSGGLAGAGMGGASGDGGSGARPEDACEAPAAIPDPAEFTTSTRGYPKIQMPSCLDGRLASGPEMAFEFTAALTGLLDLELHSEEADFSLSLRQACTDAATEVACSERAGGAGAIEKLRTPIEAGQTLFIVVDGSGANQAGKFTLLARSRATLCGDAERDPGEQCDDGNTADDDGCSTSCELDSTEVEPNDELAAANEYSAPFLAELSAESDEDFVSVGVDSPGSRVTVVTDDLGDGACYRQLMDPALEILDLDGELIAANDDAGGGNAYCAKIVLDGADAGTYVVRVLSGGGVEAPFPYQLRVTVEPPI